MPMATRCGVDCGVAGVRDSGDLLGVYRQGGVGASCWVGDSGGWIGKVSASYSWRFDL